MNHFNKININFMLCLFIVLITVSASFELKDPMYGFEIEFGTTTFLGAPLRECTWTYDKPKVPFQMNNMDYQLKGETDCKLEISSEPTKVINGKHCDSMKTFFTYMIDRHDNSALNRIKEMLLNKEIPIKGESSNFKSLDMVKGITYKSFQITYGIPLRRYLNEDFLQMTSRLAIREEPGSIADLIQVYEKYYRKCVDDDCRSIVNMLMKHMWEEFYFHPSLGKDKHRFLSRYNPKELTDIQVVTDFYNEVYENDNHKMYTQYFGGTNIHLFTTQKKTGIVVEERFAHGFDERTLKTNCEAHLNQKIKEINDLWVTEYKAVDISKYIMIFKNPPMSHGEKIGKTIDINKSKLSKSA